MRNNTLMAQNIMMFKADSTMLLRFFTFHFQPISLQELPPFQINCHVFRTDTESVMIKIKRDGYSNFIQSVSPPGRSTIDLEVLTSYSCKMYRVESIVTELSPSTHFFLCQRTGAQLCMGEYFQTKYNIALLPNQPLLKVKQSANQDIFLPSELCFQVRKSGSSDPETKKQQTSYIKYKEAKISQNKSHFTHINDLVTSINKVQTFKDWNLAIEQAPEAPDFEQFREPNVIVADDSTVELVDVRTSRVPLRQGLRLQALKWIFAYEDSQTSLAINII